MDGIVQGQYWAEQSNFRSSDALDRRCGEDRRVWCGYQQWSVVMLRKADPVKAQFISKYRLFKHLLHHASSQFRLKQARRSRPTCFIHCSDAIGGRWQEGSFHTDTLFLRKAGSKLSERFPTLPTLLNFSSASADRLGDRSPLFKGYLILAPKASC